MLKQQRRAVVKKSQDPEHHHDAQPRGSHVVSIIILVYSVVMAAAVLCLTWHFMVLHTDLEMVRAQVCSAGDCSTRIFKRDARSTPPSLPSGMTGISLEGVHPYQHITNKGHIGPWIPSTGTADLVELVRNGTEISMKQGGTYFIHAQVYYITSAVSNSYEIVRMSSVGTERQCLTVCASQANLVSIKDRGEAQNQVNEVSCFTGVTVQLQPGDRVYLNQIERNRYLNLDKGATQVGIIKISY